LVNRRWSDLEIAGIVAGILVHEVFEVLALHVLLVVLAPMKQALTSYRDGQYASGTNHLISTLLGLSEPG
jgi:hypothetical protein